MIKTKKTLIFGILFLFLIGNALALTTNIDIKPSFSENEEVYFDYSILSNEDVEVTYIVSVDCPDLPQALLSFETANLQKDILFTREYTYLTVPPEADSQECRAILSIAEPEEITDERYFLIETKESFEFDIKLDKKVFVKDENIVISYESSVDPEINAVLTYPDGKKEQITLPATINAEQIGTYTIEVTASKEGYKPVSLTDQFGVIEREAEIEEGPPEDRPAGTASPGTPQEEARKKRNILIILGLVAGIILIVVIVYFLLRKNKSKIAVKSLS